MKVYWTDIAIDSLNRVFDFVEVMWNENVAEQFLFLIDQSIDLLSQQPEIGQTMMDTGFRYILVHKNVSLFYEYQFDFLKIILVWDNRQDPALLTEILNSYK